MDQHSCHTMRQPFNYFNCRPSVDPFSQFYLFRTTMMESTTNPPERSSRKICTISCAATICWSPIYTTSQRNRSKLRLHPASTPRNPYYFPTKNFYSIGYRPAFRGSRWTEFKAFRKSWLECYLVHSLGFIVLFFAQPNVQHLSSMSFNTSKSIYRSLHLY